MLLDRAVEDELAARSLLPIEGVTDAGVGFHVQQAVEKSLKAMLAFKGVEFPYSHDLDGLVRLCEKNGIEVPDDLFGVGRLSVFGVRLRYDVSPVPRLDRDQALKWAAVAIAWTQSVIDSASGGSTQSDGELPE
ncbi:MAG: HEPN domain-containing protein [Solirubrobacteraceae bacterium]